MEESPSWEASFLSDTPTVSAIHWIGIHGRVTKEHLWSISWVNSINSTPSHAVSVRSVKNCTPSSKLRPLNWSLAGVSWPTLCTHVISEIHAIHVCPAHLSILVWKPWQGLWTMNSSINLRCYLRSKTVGLCEDHVLSSVCPSVHLS